MTRTQIDCFRAVRSTLSFSKAANSLYISQPAISKNISKLEAELGFALFERTGNNLEVTPAGELFYEYLQLSDDAFLRMMDRARRLGAKSGSVHVGCPETWSPANVMKAVMGGENVQVEANKLSTLLEKLSSGKYDAVITHDFYTPALSGIAAKTLTTTGTGILYSKERFGEVSSTEAFIDTSFILFDRDIEKRFISVIKKQFSDYSYSPPLIHCSQLPTALLEVYRGNGVMLFTDWDSAATDPSYGYFRLEERIPVKVLYNSDDASPSTADFVQKLLSHSWEE